MFPVNHSLSVPFSFLFINVCNYQKIFAKLPISQFVLVMRTFTYHPVDILHQEILYERSKNVPMDRGVGIYLFCLCCV